MLTLHAQYPPQHSSQTSEEVCYTDRFWIACSILLVSPLHRRCFICLTLVVILDSRMLQSHHSRYTLMAECPDIACDDANDNRGSLRISTCAGT